MADAEKEAVVSTRTLIEVEDSIKKTGQDVETSILEIGNCLLEIEDGKLYTQVEAAEYKSIYTYIAGAEDRLNLSRQKLSDYRIIAENQRKFKNRLSAIGCDLTGNVYKLRFLGKASDKYGNSDEVFTKFKSSSLKEFKEYSRGDEIEKQEKKPQLQHYCETLEDKKRLKGFVRKIEAIEKADEMVYIVGIKSDYERECIEEALSDLRTFEIAS